MPTRLSTAIRAKRQVELILHPPAQHLSTQISPILLEYATSMLRAGTEANKIYQPW